MTRAPLAGLLLEIGLGLLAVGLGAWTRHPPFATFAWSWPGLLAGTAATAPMLAGFLALWRSDHRIARAMRERVDEIVHGVFRHASALEVALVAIAAGVAEEALFRGFLQGLFEEKFGPRVGLWSAALLFGLAHPITRSYVVVTAVFGYYLGWLWQVSDNLLAPITAHILYDFFVLLILIRDQRWGEPLSPPRRQS